jgi:hypothetical protein
MQDGRKAQTPLKPIPPPSRRAATAILIAAVMSPPAFPLVLPGESLAYVILSQAHVIHSNAYCHPGDSRDPGFRGTVVARFAGSGNVINSKSLPHADGATAVHVDRRIYPL